MDTHTRNFSWMSGARWAGTCEIQESFDRIGPLIARRMPFESVVMRAIDQERGRVETLVRAPAGGRPGDSLDGDRSQ